MAERIDVRFNYGGTWKLVDNKLHYVNGEVDVVYDFDPDYMCYQDILFRFRNLLGFATLEKVLVLEPGKDLIDGLFLVHDDASIRKLLDYIRKYSWVFEIDFYADHEINEPVFQPKIFSIEWHADHEADEPTDRTDDMETRAERTEAEMGERESGEPEMGEKEFGEAEMGERESADNLNGVPNGYVSEGDGEGGETEGNEDSDDSDSDNNAEDESARLEDRERYEGSTGANYFRLGMTFTDAKEAREAISRYVVTYGLKLKINPNEPLRIRVKCINEAAFPFTLLISKDGQNAGLAVKTLVEDHRCFRHYSIPSASANFLAKHFKDKIYKNLKYRVADMVDDAKKQLKVNVSFAKCKRANRKIIQELDGSYKVQFGYLEAYAATLKRSNPGTKAEIELCKEALQEGRRVFRRLFICFDACKKNWIGGCRPLIGLDGCFLRGVCKGQLLTAVGQDGDNQMVPIAWAVVDKENKSNWRWFLSWLVQELQLGDGSKLTIISDMQKGLIDAVSNVLPEAEHRWCARHIYSNWSKKYGGGEMKKKFFICAWSTFQEEFKDNLAKIGLMNQKAAEDLLRYPPHTWYRAYFSSRCQSMMVDNNISECFNAWVNVARMKPIISMLDDIRLQTMNLIKNNKVKCESWFNEWSPSCMAMLQDNKEIASSCQVVFNGDTGYEIGEGDDKHTIFLDKQLCTCRQWELSGIPCAHSICALYHAKVDPLSVIPKWYHKSCYTAAYKYHLQPVPGKKFMKTDEYQPIEPPPRVKMAGRPRGKRIRASNETRSTNKLSKKGAKLHCGICKDPGHNRRLCPHKGNQSSVENPSAIPANASVENTSAPTANAR